MEEASESTLKRLQDRWQRAGLTQWRPSFEGRRPWAVVRARLLSAATAEVASEKAEACLYITEQFRTAIASAITFRRDALWKPIAARKAPTKPLQFIGELKRIQPDAEGAALTIRHIPDLLFRIDKHETRLLQRRFGTQLLQWRSEDHIRLVVAGFLDIANKPAPSLYSLALLAVNIRWLPVTRAERN